MKRLFLFISFLFVAFYIYGAKVTTILDASSDSILSSGQKIYTFKTSNSFGGNLSIYVGLNAYSNSVDSLTYDSTTLDTLSQIGVTVFVSPFRDSLFVPIYSFFIGTQTGNNSFGVMYPVNLFVLSMLGGGEIPFAAMMIPPFNYIRIDVINMGINTYKGNVYLSYGGNNNILIPPSQNQSTPEPAPAPKPKPAQ